MNSSRVILILCLLAGSAMALAEVRDGQVIRFQVRDAETRELLFQGVERISVKAGQVSKRTVYRALDDREVMVEQVRYRLDSLMVDEFVSEHPVSGERMSLQRRGTSLDIRYVARRGQQARRSDELTWDAQTRLGKTLHHTIVRNWDSLTGGEVQRFKLLVPSKFTHYDFQLAGRASDDGGFVFRLEPSSWLLRQLVSPMDFHYDGSKRATRYLGPTTVGYYDDPDRRVEIRFSY